MANRLCVGLMASAAAAVLLAREIDGHAVQLFPISRQYSWSTDVPEVTGSFLEHAPDTYSGDGGIGVKGRQKNFPQDLLAIVGDKFPLYFFEHLENGNYNESNEVAERRGVCGDPRQGRADDDRPYSTPSSEWEVLSTFESGAEIEMIIGVGAKHYGHFEFFLCDTGDLPPNSVVTQECLNKHPLSRVAKSNESPVDPNYPGRYYPDPQCRADTGEVEQTTYKNNESRFDDEYNVRMTYRLPEIECSHCVLQMAWFTGHICAHVGYEEFNPPSWNSECAPNKEDWVNLEFAASTGVCGVTTGYPQEFWSCSDIALTSNGNTQETTTPAPTVGDSMNDDEPATTTPAPTAGDSMNDDEPATTTSAPTSGDSMNDDGGEEEVEYPVHLGCFHDDRLDRVLKGVHSNNMMTTEMCLERCMEDGAVFAATQYGSECWCSDEVDMEYDRHGDGDDAECDTMCAGSTTESCGGYNAFDLYQLGDLYLSGEEMSAPVDECQGVYEQCGGDGYDGSTCCTEGHVCTTMGSCYSQCRPI